MGARAAQEKSGEVVSEADELRSFVGTEREGWWVWVASDARTRPVVAMVAGDRSERTARCPWDALPDGDRDGAVVAADFLAAYRAVVPADRHAAAGKDAGLTARVERFWLAVRPRCARFVRRTLSFSKCAENHTGSLGYFIRHYNASLRRGHYRFLDGLSFGKEGDVKVEGSKGGERTPTHR